MLNCPHKITEVKARYICKILDIGVLLWYDLSRVF